MAPYSSWRTRDTRRPQTDIQVHLLNYTKVGTLKWLTTLHFNTTRSWGGATYRSLNTRAMSYVFWLQQHNYNV